MKKCCYPTGLWSDSSSVLQFSFQNHQSPTFFIQRKVIPTFLCPTARNCPLVLLLLFQQPAGSTLYGSAATRHSFVSLFVVGFLFCFCFVFWFQWPVSSTFLSSSSMLVLLCFGSSAPSLFKPLSVQFVGPIGLWVPQFTSVCETKGLCHLSVLCPHFHFSLLCVCVCWGEGGGGIAGLKKAHTLSVTLSVVFQRFSLNQLLTKFITEQARPC